MEVRLALHHQSQDAGHTGRGLLLVSFPPHSCWMEECKGSRCRLERVCAQQGARQGAPCLQGVGLRREGRGKGAVNSHAAPMGRRKDATYTLSSSYPRGTKFGVAETDDVCKVAILAMLADTVARDSRRKTETRFSPRGRGLFSPLLLPFCWVYFREPNPPKQTQIVGAAGFVTPITILVLWERRLCFPSGFWRRNGEMATGFLSKFWCLVSKNTARRVTTARTKLRTRVN